MPQRQQKPDRIGQLAQLAQLYTGLAAPMQEQQQQDDRQMLTTALQLLGLQQQKAEADALAGFRGEQLGLDRSAQAQKGQEIDINRRRLALDEAAAPTELAAKREAINKSIADSQAAWTRNANDQRQLDLTAQAQKDLNQRSGIANILDALQLLGNPTASPLALGALRRTPGMEPVVGAADEATARAREAFIQSQLPALKVSDNPELLRSAFAQYPGAFEEAMQRRATAPNPPPPPTTIQQFLPELIDIGGARRGMKWLQEYLKDPSLAGAFTSVKG